MSTLWKRFAAKARPGAAIDANMPLQIRAAGLCCAVGYRLPAASTAIRAGVDHFQHGHFRTGRGDRIVEARLPDQRLWGAPRLARWLAWALRDCVAGFAPDDCGAPETRRIAVVWLAPPPARTGLQPDEYDEIYSLAVQELGLRFHAASGVLALGRAGLSAALSRASWLLQQHELQAVIVAGTDSLLEPHTLNELLGQGRLLVPGNSDGFVPGEAAAAVLLTPVQDDRPGLFIAGHAQDSEAGRVDGSVPSRAQGLTRAMRAALSRAECAYGDLQFQCSDQNGEAFYTREAAHAVTRLAPVGGHKLPLVTLADCIGEVGAAMGPAMLAHLSHQMPHPLGPGDCGLLHLAGDDGLRCAAVLRHA